MRKRKGNLLQRIMASMLSAVLIAGMALEAVPLTALAQEIAGGGYNQTEESVIGNPVTEEVAEPEPGEKESIPESGEGAQESDEEKTEGDPATEKTEDTEEPEEAKKPVENPAEEGQDGITGQESAAEEEGADITDSNGVQPEKPTAPQKAVRAASAAVQEGESTPIEPFKGEGWSIDENGKLTIESTAGMEHWSKYTDGAINSHVNSVRAVDFKEAVTYLADDVFHGCNKLTSITIPESVESIGDAAFLGCSSLENITIPDGVTSIGETAFSECSSLTKITIPESVKSIGGGAFQNCNDLNGIVVIPDGVTSIEMMTFSGCSGLEEITIPNSVISIGMCAFVGCSSLTEITIPESVTSIGAMAFMQCSSLESVTMLGSKPPELTTEYSMTDHFEQCKFKNDGVEGIKVPTGTAAQYKAAWQEYQEHITEWTDDTEDDLLASGEGWRIDSTGKLTIESAEGMTNWENGGRGDHAAKVISAEIAVNDEKPIKTIGEYAFTECPNLTSIVIADSVENIGKWAFRKCTSLKDVKLSNKLQGIGEYTFYECGALTEITIPDSVSTIEQFAFARSSLTGIAIPNNVANIGISAFGYCNKLEEVVLPSGMDSIANALFYDCSNLASITIPESVTIIKGTAFQNCTGLTAITIPNNVTSIGAEAFSGCSNLETVTMKGHTPPTLEAKKDGTKDHFTGCKFVTDDTEGVGINVPSGSAESYKTAWTEWAKYITDGTDGTEDDLIASGDGWRIDSTGKLTIESAEGMHDWTIYGRGKNAEDVTSAEIKMNPDSAVETIATDSFAWCTNLESITIPESVKTIEKYAFTRLKKLTKITIPASVESIGEGAFWSCSSLETVTMEGAKPPALGVSESGTTEVFTGCKFVKEITKGIKVPEETAAAYKKAWEEWQKYIAEGSAPDTPDTPTDEEKVEAAKKAVEAALKDITVNNTTTQESLAAAIQEAVNAALKEAGIDGSDVTVEVKDFVKTDATTESAGSVTANITITSGGESASVPVNQPIDKLPDTPADQVAAVKKAVEEALQDAIDKALSGTTVTNENAQEIVAKITELIPDAVAKAFEAAGVGMDAIAVGELAIQIDPAAADKEGSIQVTIPLTSNADASLSESASVQVPVMKPGGEEDPGQEAEAAKKAVEEALKNIPVTNETTPEDILAALKEALGEDVAVEGIDKFEKTDATEETPGKISLSIRIIINGKTVIVNVDADIAQLSRKTGVYVRFMDAYQMEGSTPVYKYTGLAIKPAVEVYNNETLLTLGKDYTLGYKNNTKPGTAAALTVRGKGSFSGTSNAVNFQIINADIKKDTDHPTEMTVIQNTKVSPVIMNGTKKLTTKDYELEGEGLVNSKYAAPTAEGETKTLTVKGKGSYAGSSFEIQVKVIERKAAGKLSVKVDSKFKPVYDGTALHLSSLFRKPQEGEGTETAAEGQEPAGVITVTDAKDKTKILKEGTDFTVVCTSSLTNAGTVKFTLTGMGAYTGSVTKSFRISPRKVTDSSRFSVTFDEAKTYEYKAAGTEVDGLLVKYLGETEAETDDKILIPGVDYKVTYSNHKKVSGTKDAGLKVTFLGNYKGSSAVQKTFKIAPAKLSSANTVVTVPDKVYSKGNRAYKSTPIVTVDGAVIKSSQYTVSYEWATASQAADDTKYVEDNRVKITIAEGDTWAKVRVTVTPKEKGSYGLAEEAVLRGEYYVRKADQAVNLTKAKVTFFDKAGTRLSGLAYNGNPFYTPAGNNAESENAPDGPNAVYVRVTVSGAVVDPSLYEVTWTNATAKGKATVVIRGTGTATDKGMAVGSKNQSVTIKAMALKGKTLKSYVEGMADVMNSLKDLFF